MTLGHHVAAFEDAPGRYEDDRRTVGPPRSALDAATVHEYFYGADKSFTRTCDRPYAGDRANWLRAVEPQYTHSAGCILVPHWKHDHFPFAAEWPLPNELLHAALGHHEGYASVWRGYAGDAVYLANPPRLFVQTPLGEDFLSFGVCHSLGDRFAGVLIAQKGRCEDLCSSLEIPVSWQRTNLPLALVPLKLLRRRWATTIGVLWDLMRDVKVVEDSIVEKVEEHTELGRKVRQLHACNSTLLQLERRWHFEKKLAAVILAVMHEARDAGFESLSTGSAYQKMLTESTTLSESLRALEPDLTVLPRRIQNSLTALYNLNAQQDTKATIALAEATMRDSSAMKTIAAMTLIFLPATFLSSFFSMSFFDWHSSPNEAVTNSLWVYFAVAVPLTAIVIVGWIVLNPFTRSRFVAWMGRKRRLEKLDDVAAKEV